MTEAEIVAEEMAANRMCDYMLPLIVPKSQASVEGMMFVREVAKKMFAAGAMYQREVSS